MLRGIFRGPPMDLAGATALLLSDPDDPLRVLAQFDDTTIEWAYGWHRFPRSAFTILEPENEEL